jgi:hypothetical protein
MSTAAESVYECDLCIWMMRIPADGSFDDVQAAYDAHNCKQNSLKKKRIPEQT